MSNESDFCPQWTEEAPKPGTYRSIFKWGAPNVFKHPNTRLYSMLKNKFNMSDDDFKQRKNEGLTQVSNTIPVQLSNDHIQVLSNIVGQENIQTDDFSRVKYANGKTLIEALRLRNGIHGAIADVVIHPRNKEEIQNIVAYCNKQSIPIYPYGGGSSVNFGFKCEKGGISLVLSTHMNRLIALNEINQTATVEPGIMGPAFEAILNDAPNTLKAGRRYTCGHFPQSFEYSTVGGWIVTLGSGQQSSYYGDMYNIVLSQEYVTPTGVIKTLDYPATATGPKINDIMKGNEGSFGILVSATVKIFRYMPENSQQFAYMFPSWDAAVNAAREISQGEFGMPSVFRISDAEETDVGLKLYGVEDIPFVDSIISFRGYSPMKRCLFIGQSDGERDFAINVKEKVKKICKLNGGLFLTGYPVKKWSHSRYLDPYMREDLNDYDIMIDTLETGVTWDNLHNLHQNVRKYVKSRPNTICMTHASHFYPQGTNLYFIFITRVKDISDFEQFLYGIIDQIEKHGGSLSHHHGVGKMIGPWMERHLGKNQMDVLRVLKKHFDPNNIMNPGGTLGLDLLPKA